MNLILIPPTGHKLILADLIKTGTNFPNQGYLLNSGTSSLFFLLKSLNITKNSKVLIPAYSCPTVAAAVLRAGHIPILCDINRNTLSYDLQIFYKKIKSKKIQAVIWVNLFGITQSIPQLDVHVILDNAQSLVQQNENTSNSVAFIHSFGRGKPINSLEGGIAVVNNPEYFSDLDKKYAEMMNPNIIDNLKYLINFFGYKIFYHPILYKILYSLPFLHLGETKFEPDFIATKMNKNNLEVISSIYNRIIKIQKMRQQICLKYDQILDKFEDRVTFFKNNIFYRYPVLLKDHVIRVDLIKELQDNSIGAFSLYPFPLNSQPGLKEILNDSNHYPNAEYISRNLFTLPVNEFINDKVFYKTEKIFKKYLN